MDFILTCTLATKKSINTVRSVCGVTEGPYNCFSFWVIGHVFPDKVIHRILHIVLSR